MRKKGKPVLVHFVWYLSHAVTHLEIKRLVKYKSTVYWKQKKNSFMDNIMASVKADSTSKEGVVLKVLNAVLAQSVLSTANEPTNQIFCFLWHVCYLLWELEPLLCKNMRGIIDKTEIKEGEFLHNNFQKQIKFLNTFNQL